MIDSVTKAFDVDMQMRQCAWANARCGLCCSITTCTGPQCFNKLSKKTKTRGAKVVVYYGNQGTISAQTMHNQCTISAKSVHNQERVQEQVYYGKQAQSL